MLLRYDRWKFARWVAGNFALLTTGDSFNIVLSDFFSLNGQFSRTCGVKSHSRAGKSLMVCSPRFMCPFGLFISHLPEC